MKTTALTTKFQKGFTLIELLVVIAILGVLAAALLATLDPLEQIKRGQDTQKKAIASEFIGAVQRYYTNKSAYPWTSTSATPAGDGCNGAADPDQVQMGTGMIDGAGSCVSFLVSAGELKTSFVQQPKSVTDTIYVTQDSTTGDIYSCFMPASKAQQLDKNTVYTDKKGTLDTTNSCKANNSAAGVDCYWCAK